MSTAAQAHANRANSQHSTGPKTPEGKAAAAQNAFRHGLASRQLIIPGEDPAAYDALLHDLTQEHAPATVTEVLLVTQMAQNFWFIQRCLRLHQDSFARVDMSKQLPILSMPLLTRYESAVNRAFYKALNTLQALQKTRKAVEIGSVSQIADPPPAPEPPPAAPPHPKPASKPVESTGGSLFDFSAGYPNSDSSLHCSITTSGES